MSDRRNLSRTNEYALRTAAVAIVAVLASFGVLYLLCLRLGLNVSPAILAAALTVGLMRRDKAPHFDTVKFVSLPLLALAAVFVGLALRTLPLVGALLFAGGIAISIGLRRYGERGAAIGRTIALPFVMMLVVPVRIDIVGGLFVTTLVVIAAGLAAFLSSTIVTRLAQQVGFLTQTRGPGFRPPPRPPREGVLPVQTRMALQMFVALLLAFAIGMTVFPEHWSWIVLSAFIVCSGAVGRGDAIYKGLGRFGGAAAGTFVGALFAHAASQSGAYGAASIFVALFIGIWLGQINYAYWAACATLIFALLQGLHGQPPLALFLTRLVGIAIGALCGVAATWFIYPIRTEHVVRRRIGDTLRAVRELLETDEAHWAKHHDLLNRCVAELERIAPPVRFHYRLLGASRPEEHPATWVRKTLALLEHALGREPDRAHIAREEREIRAMLRHR